MLDWNMVNSLSFLVVFWQYENKDYDVNFRMLFGSAVALVLLVAVEAQRRVQFYSDYYSDYCLCGLKHTKPSSIFVIKF